MTDPRTPVIVGVAQHTQRPDDVPDVRQALEPVALMALAVRAAADDAGAPALAGRIDTVFVPQPLSRRYPDPGRLVAERLGLDGARSVRALVGGNSPQLMVNEAADAIARGDCDTVAITGAEAMHSRFRAKREGVELDWERSDVPACPDEVGDDRPGSNFDEDAHGLGLPIHVYPLFETALRAKAGRDVATHQAATGRLWARCSEVAADHPHAWSRERFDAGEIVSPSGDNRMVAFPYTKRMCANMTVDQGAALVLTSYETARAAGVGDERMVFPLAGADAHDHFLVSERASLAESPAIRTAARAAFEATGIGVDDVARFDLYSCFPSAVQVALGALGLHPDDPRPLSLTGGLAFFGGPGNSYVVHSIAEMVEACRADPGSVGLVTGVGWYLTKHSVGLYSSAPPPRGFRRIDPVTTQARVDGLPSRKPVGPYDGRAVVEATAVVYERDGTPTRAIVTAIERTGRRVLANSDDPGVLDDMVTTAWEGREVAVRSDTEVNRLAV